MLCFASLSIYCFLPLCVSCFTDECICLLHSMFHSFSFPCLPVCTFPTFLGERLRHSVHFTSTYSRCMHSAKHGKKKLHECVCIWTCSFGSIKTGLKKLWSELPLCKGYCVTWCCKRWYIHVWKSKAPWYDCSNSHYECVYVLPDIAAWNSLQQTYSLFRCGGNNTALCVCELVCCCCYCICSENNKYNIVLYLFRSQIQYKLIKPLWHQSALS